MGIKHEGICGSINILILESLTPISDNDNFGITTQTVSFGRCLLIRVSQVNSCAFSIPHANNQNDPVGKEPHSTSIWDFPLGDR